MSDDILTYEHVDGRTQGTYAGTEMDSTLHRDPDWELISGTRPAAHPDDDEDDDLEAADLPVLFDQIGGGLALRIHEVSEDDLELLEEALRDMLALVETARNSSNPDAEAAPSASTGADVGTDLQGLRRGELDELALSEGVEEPDKLPNADAVRDAIRAKRAASSS